MKFTASFAAKKALGDLAARRSPLSYGSERQNPGHSSLNAEHNALCSTCGWLGELGRPYPEPRAVGYLGYWAVFLGRAMPQGG